MQVTDAVAILLTVGAGVAFIVGERALARVDDMQAIYWLTMGVGSLYAAVKLAKPGTRA
jgi:hypothetical protein